MGLPYCYLDAVEYDKEHTQLGEFTLRKQYIELYARARSQALAKEDKCMILKRCSNLNHAELRELIGFNLLSKEELLEVYDTNFGVVEKKLIENPIHQFLETTTSCISTIPTGENTTHDGGAIYDPVRKIILSVSGTFNNGRNIKVTRMSDGTHGSTSTRDVIPFGTHGLPSI